MTALSSAELAWYATGRFYEAEDGSLADYGYFLHLPFAEASLFDGAIMGETTAHFTFAAKPFQAKAVVNGALKLGLDPVGEFSLYLQRRPAGDFGDPASFAQGECIATFRRASLAVGTTVAANLALNGASVSLPLVGANVFTAHLIASVPFEFGGRRYDLEESVGRGVTQFGTAAAAAIAPPPGYRTVLPFTGSAIALGSGAT
ncbi:hypothetical protein FCE95_15435 [Luteimonas gilva]|uniref:Uncharacterized protein n=1 Tax=Luteimonas gilva TaxID=2572684 RepID=A0A4U5JJI1_9GAMM|nr:hypothetical protein [Luteimonas gilva]TKR29524.1 hypothetical protein FCE95_15435 [Luteimonas gilva]